MNAVVDASVVVKWVLPDPAREEDLDQALALLAAVRSGDVSLRQPPHWLAEVAAVVTRLRPEVAEEAIDLLDALELPVVSDPEVLKRASRISRELSHHLFDTLYHALALEHDCACVSADETYIRKARHLGGLVSLSDWSRSSGQINPV